MPINIKGKSYRTVWERLNAAHTPESSEPKGIKGVLTEVVSTSPLLVIRATITFEDGRSFTGLSEAQLDAAPNSADGTNPMECAETSAVGRALAFAGYYGSGDGIAGAEEMRQAQRSVAPGRASVPPVAAGGTWPTSQPAPRNAETGPLPPTAEEWDAAASQFNAEARTAVQERAVAIAAYELAYDKLAAVKGAISVKGQPLDRAIHPDTATAQIQRYTAALEKGLARATQPAGSAA